MHTESLPAASYLTDAEGDRLLKIAEVAARVSLSKSAIYAKVNDGTFPSPFRLGPGAVRWKKSEVDAWISALPAAFPNPGAEAP